MISKGDSRSRTFWMPALPIQRVLQAELDQLCSGEEDENKLTALGLRLFPDNAPKEARNRLRKLMAQTQIEFDSADHVLCRLDLIQLWRIDDELRAILQQVNLLALDISRPTCEEARQTTDELVCETYARTHNFRVAAAELGVGKEKVKQIVTREAVAA